MNYFSTRNHRNKVSAPEAIVQGIASDGGLFVPSEFPQLGDLDHLMKMGYQELAAYILGLYFGELGEEVIRNAVDRAYDDKFIEGVVPVHAKGEVAFLELFHGRTCAFKDMALSVLPHLLLASLKALSIKKEVIILVATSGDTGKAALEGFLDVDGVHIAVYYPHGGVSEVQRLQMATTGGENTFVCAIRGNFDDAQTGVKKIFADEDLKQRLADEGYLLSSANSINIGRLVPQIVYYVYGYLQLVQMGKIKLGESVNVVVPTGNFGNVLSAYYAQRMGLPIERLIVASNDNRVLTDFFDSGEYDGNRTLLLTSSPSMDILISSNLERLLFHISDGDTSKVRDAMSQLQRDRKYEWSGLVDQPFSSYAASEDEVSEWIANVYEQDGYVMDPHTAVAYTCYQKYVKDTKDKKVTMIAATASPFKFSKKVLFSIDKHVPVEEFESIESLAEVMAVEIPEGLSKLRQLEERHKKICGVNDMEAVLTDRFRRDR